jgi:chromosome segregation ATPase
MRRARRQARFAARPALAQTRRMKPVLPLLLFAIAVLVPWLVWRGRQRVSSRQRAIRDLLDAADALEARLRIARDEIEAVAGSHENPVRGAMQDLLRQRLWLQENAETAELAQLDAVRRSLDSARTTLEQQLQRVSQARAGH